MRIANIEPDIKRVLKYDIFFRQIRKNRKEMILTIWFCIVMIIMVFILERPIYFILPFAAIILFLYFFTLFKNPSISQLYGNGMLVPSIVVQTNPVELLVLTSAMKDDEEVWGIVIVSVPNMDDFNLDVGTKIPGVANEIQYGENCLDERFYFHPLYWATDDANQIQEAVNRIGNGEWDILGKCIEKSNILSIGNKGYNKFVFYDKTLNPI